MNHYLPIALLGALLLLAPVTFTACESPQEEVDINLISDFRGLAEAIKEGSQSLSEKLSLIEAAVSGGFADAEAAQQLLEQAVSSLGGSVAKKLVAIETAVKSQTLSLETKLGLIEAAVAAGFADSAAAQALLSAAVSSLSGSAEEKLAVIEGAVSSQTTSLSSKLSLIETAVKEGLADRRTGQSLLSLALDALGSTVSEQLVAIDLAIQNQTSRLLSVLNSIDAILEYRLADVQEALSLIQKAVEALSGTAEENLAALEEAVQSQLAGLSSKLALIEAAVTEGFADNAAAQDLLQKAIETLDGTLEERLAAVETAVKGQSSTLSTKLGLIEAAVTNGLADGKAGQELIKEAIEALSGTAEEKLEAIVSAVNDQTTGFAAKLDLIQTVVAEGFAANLSEMALIDAALASLTGTTEEKLGDIATAMESQTTSLATKLEAIRETVADSLANANEALRLIQTAIASLKTSIDGVDPEGGTTADSVVSMLDAINSTLEGDVTGILNEIFAAIQGLKDYSVILSDIQQVLESMIPIPPTLDFSEEYVESSEVMMLPNDVLFIHYYVSSETDFKVTVAPSDDITATVCPDPNQPLEGDIKLETGSTVTNGKTRVVVTVTNDGGSISSTLAITEAYFKPIAPITDITDTIHRDFAGQTLELKYKTNLDCSKPEVPDTLRNEDVPWLEVLSQDQTDDITTIQVKLLPNLGHIFRTTSVTVKETRYHHRSLEFIIKQKNDKVIEFEDGDLEAKIINKGVDTNFDNSISMSEAQAVTSLYALFGDDLTNGTDYISFDEFQYFTGITTIPEGSFNNWTKLRSITLPESIAKIDVDFRDVAGGSTAKLSILQNCPRLASIKGKFATADQKALIYKQEGASTSKLVKVVEVIGSNEEIELPEGIDTIARYAFYGSNYKMVKLPSSLKVIGESAFEYSMIETLSLPMSGPDPEKDTCCVTTIYDNTFAHCHSLKTIYGAYNKGQLRVFAAGHALYRDTTMYAYALGCSDDKLIIPDELDIRRLPDHLFEMVDQDNQLVLGRCYLEVIALPSSINHIGARTFYGLVTLQRLFFHGSTPPAKCGQNAFDEIGDRLKILVPSGAEINSFATALHVDLSRFNTWQVWDPQ